MRPWQFVRSRGEQVIALGNGFHELFPWEWRLLFQSFVRELFKNIDIDMIILCKIEHRVKSMPKVIDF